MKYYSRLFFLMLFTCGFFYSIHAQTWLWGRAASSGGPSGEGLSIATDDSGAVYFIGGYVAPSITFGTITLTNSGGNDGFLVKYDTSGTVVWAKNFGGSTSDLVYNVSTDHSGNVFVIGEFYSPTITIGTTTLVNAVNSGFSVDIFIAKFDASGNLIYAKREGGNNDDWGYSIAEDSSGNSYFTGLFYSPTITFGATILTNTNAIAADIFVTKYDPMGNPVWATSAGGASDDNAMSLAVDFAGNVFVTGYSKSPNISFGASTFTNSGGGAYDVFLAKYDSSGNFIWAQTTGGTAKNDFSNCIAIDNSDNIFITGTFYSQTINFGSITLNNTDITGGTSDAFFAKLDSSGNVLWAKKAGGAGLEMGWYVSTTSNGNTYFTGSFYSPVIGFDSDTLLFPVNGSDPMFIVKYDGNGNVLCFSGLGSGGDDQIAVAADPFGNAYVGGDFIPTLILGNDTLVSNGFELPFIAKYSCEDVIVTPPPPQSDCEIYIPNAFSPNGDNQNDFECVRSNCIQSMHLAIYDRWGELVFESFDQNKCWNGMYRGEKMESAVFVYTFDAVLLNGDKVQKSGNISLVK